MAEAYHKEALRKQRILDKKHAALARIALLQVGSSTFLSTPCPIDHVESIFRVYIQNPRGNLRWDLALK